MSDAPAVLAACYSDYRRLKGRKCHQIVLEVPSELWPRIYKVLGEPSITTSAWFALAALTPKAAEEYVRTLAEDQGSSEPALSKPVPTKDRRRFSELALSQQSALACDREAFRRFLNERYVDSIIYEGPIETAADAADFIRGYCRVESRSALDTDGLAGDIWATLYDEFDAWMRAAV